MKTMRLILMMGVMVITALSVQAQKKGEKTVVFKADLHCVSCKAKVEKNIPYEKGVKDLKVDMEKKTITVTFREDKNNVENLRKAIEKLDVKVDGIAGDDCPKATSCEKAKAGCCPGTANCEKSGKKK